MKKTFSHLGQIPWQFKCQVSASSSQSQQSEEQQQVAAENGVGVGATTGSNNQQTINVTTADPDVAEAGFSTVENVADTAITAEGTTALDSEEISADETDEAANYYGQQDELQTEQEEQAVGSALQIAANAAPQTAAAENELESGTSALGTVSGNTISTSVVLVIIAAFGLFLTLRKK